MEMVIQGSFFFSTNTNLSPPYASAFVSGKSVSDRRGLLPRPWSPPSCVLQPVPWSFSSSLSSVTQRGYSASGQQSALRCTNLP